MKTILKLMVMLFACANANGQLVVPHLIPCVDITPSNVVTIGPGVQANDCVKSEGTTVTFQPDQNYSIKAGEFIEFKENTVIYSDSSHQFHAYIEPEEMDLAWYYPNNTPGTVGKYDKLELGVQFDSTISAHIDNYIDDTAGDKINPFNPEEVDLYAKFWRKVGDDWHGPIKINGFFYEEFERAGDTAWNKVSNEYDFRIRFSPEYTGTWLCNVSAVVNGVEKHVHGFTFECVSSSHKGFVNVGGNKRYLKRGDEPFFPVGQNLTGPNSLSLTAEWDAEPAPPNEWDLFYKHMTELEEKGGNYFRYIVSPWQSEIEYEHLGNYSNRQKYAWEFDRLLDTANALDLVIHYNMAMHYSFGAPNYFAMTNWDWSATGDTLNPTTGPHSPCFRDDDLGYCYRNELSIVDPIDFFSDTTAMKYYKRRLRYMIARWGYSTNIGIMELMSEINNVGEMSVINRIEVVAATDSTPALYGCKHVSDPIREPYFDDSATVIPKIKSWQIEMLRYMKEDLGHNQHPFSVSYAGLPNIPGGDDIYWSDYVDIASFNQYKISVDKYEKNYTEISWNFHYPLSPLYLDKPVIHSEYGPGSGGWSSCDDEVTYVKGLSLSAFSGIAFPGMNWHGHLYTDSIWQHLKPIKELMAGIPLDEDNWNAGVPLVQSDNSVELLFLRAGETGENSKMVGAICNRTFNYRTQGSGLPCVGSPFIGDDAIYNTATNFTESDMPGSFKVGNMGVLKGYKIEWYNGVTGDYISTTEPISDLLGDLKIKFPGTLTGDWTQPIMFFKLYRSDATFLSPETVDDGMNTAIFNLKKDSVGYVEYTDWSQLENSVSPILVSPNPTQDIVNVTLPAEQLEFGNWILTDASGNKLIENKTNSRNFQIDLSVYETGIYYLLVNSERGKQVVKIVKI